MFNVLTSNINCYEKRKGSKISLLQIILLQQVCLLDKKMTNLSLNSSYHHTLLQSSTQLSAQTPKQSLPSFLSLCLTMQ